MNYIISQINKHICILFGLRCNIIKQVCSLLVYYVLFYFFSTHHFGRRCTYFTSLINEPQQPWVAVHDSGRPLAASAAMSRSSWLWQAACHLSSHESQFMTPAGRLPPQQPWVAVHDSGRQLAASAAMSRSSWLWQAACRISSHELQFMTLAFSLHT